MLEFLPWSRHVLHNCLEKYKEHQRLCIIDVELGGGCNYNCRYCDTINGHHITYSVDVLEQLIQDSGVEWLFICGLGEPTFGKNNAIFKRILSFCQKNGIKCCAFTNASLLDDELFSFIDNETLYPMFKLDSFKSEINSIIYGIENEAASRQIDIVGRLANHVKCNDNSTNICASIVPSRYNFHELCDLVDWCYKNNIFPLVGDLEDAGKGQDIYEELKLSNNELMLLKEHIRNTNGVDYSIPICPSVLFGLHIDHTGAVIVDKKTGLSCHWFWLTEPETESLANINALPFYKLSELVISNRKKHIDEIGTLLKGRERLVFGGCGGDIIDLFSFYLENMC